jgi:hypothetical protein
MFLMLLRHILDLVDVLLEAEVPKGSDDMFSRDSLFRFALGNLVGLRGNKSDEFDAAVD